LKKPETTDESPDLSEKERREKVKASILLTVFLGLLLLSTAIADPGDTLWTRTYGGSSEDYGWDVQQTTDGGFIVAGRTRSFGAGAGDLWLLKLDADGDTLWTRTSGGGAPDYGFSVGQTSDSGYIVAGYTLSFGAGGSDVYLVRTDADGNTLWARTYGGTGTDEGYSTQQTTDGGYIVAGRTTSFGGGGDDVYLVKTDANGDTLWTRAYGGSSGEGAESVQQTTDGGYIITGRAYSSQNMEDIWLLKTDANGDTLWTRTYGGSESDIGFCVQQTTDGGYIITGRTYSSERYDDVWLLKTDADGDTLWTRTYGGDGGDEGWSVQQTTDGGYIVAGATISFGAGDYDAWLLKTDADGDTLWTRTYGSTDMDWGYSVQQTAEGGYIVAGYVYSFTTYESDVWLVRVAGLQDVTVEIVPDDPPVTVPQGGIFSYTGTLTNNTEDPQVTDVWVMAVGPDPVGYYWGPFKEFHDLNLGPLETRSAHFNQRVPRMAVPGFYNYIAYCGDYRSTIMDSSYFRIEVVVGEGSGGNGWVLTGSFLEGDVADIPSQFALSGNYPNPFNASTVISYELPTDTHVKLEVYNISGQKVATLLNGNQEAGYKSVSWDASETSSGVYFYKLAAGDFTQVKRMTLLR
jgi:hypothetical protein